MRKIYFGILITLFFNIQQIEGQTTVILCASLSGSCGCTPVCCTGPSASDCNGATPNPTNGVCAPYGTGDCSSGTGTFTISGIPSNSDIDVSISTYGCGAGITNPTGLDSGDFINVNGVRVFNGNGNANASYAGCFATTGGEADIPIVLSANRLDECIEITYNITGNGGMAGPSCTLLAAGVNEFKVEQTHQKSILLSWNYASSPTATNLVIEKSMNGIDFVDVSNLDLNSAKNLFEFEDQNPFLGNNYYRIKVIHENQAIGFSDLKVVNFTAEDLIIINQFDNQSIFVQIDDLLTGSLEYALYNSIGQQIKVSKFDSDYRATRILIHELTPGYYIFSVKTDQGIISKKFWKK